MRKLKMSKIIDNGDISIWFHNALYPENLYSGEYFKTWKKEIKQGDLIIIKRGSRTTLHYFDISEDGIFPIKI